MSDSMTLRVMIEGLVQGVGYRAWAVQHASQRGLTGWVRNRTDGSVEALFSGPKAMIDAMLVLCREGPSMANVMSVAHEPAEPPRNSTFQQLPTL